MSVQEIADMITRHGVLVGGRERYRNVTIRDHKGIDLKVVNEPVDFSKPKWPGDLRAVDYAKTAEQLIELARRQELPFHLPATEILKAVECCVSEILYFAALYPERIWCKEPSPLNVRRKIVIANLVLPPRAFPLTLVRDIQKTRNLVEHQFCEPDIADCTRSLESMRLFFDRTKRILDLLEQVSFFEYRVPNDSREWRIQMRRDQGEIVLFQGEYSKQKAWIIETGKMLSRDPDFCTMLIQRILTDLDQFDGDSFSFFNLYQVVPQGLGPDRVIILE
jgi:hypothetical protein